MLIREYNSMGCTLDCPLLAEKTESFKDALRLFKTKPSHHFIIKTLENIYTHDLLVILNFLSLVL